MKFKIGKNFSSGVKKISGYIENKVLNSVHMELMSNRELVIEGCERIEEYDENIVKIVASKMSVVVFGKDLKIRCLTPDSLIVMGVISSIEFLT